jgi:hypothetical protein
MAACGSGDKRVSLGPMECSVTWVAGIRSSLLSSVGSIVFGMEDGVVSIFGLVFGFSIAAPDSHAVWPAGATGAVAGAEVFRRSRAALPGKGEHADYQGSPRLDCASVRVSRASEDPGQLADRSAGGASHAGDGARKGARRSDLLVLERGVSHLYGVRLVFTAQFRALFTVHGRLSLRTAQDLNYLHIVCAPIARQPFPGCPG